MTGVLIVTATVMALLTMGYRYSRKSPKNPVRFFKISTAISSLIVFSALLFTPVSLFGETTAQTSGVNGNAMIGVALSTGLAALGAGIAVGLTGAAAIGAISEDPKMLGRSLIFVGLAEGIAIYGLVISIMIFGRV